MKCIKCNDDRRTHLLCRENRLWICNSCNIIFDVYNNLRYENVGKGLEEHQRALDNILKRDAKPLGFEERKENESK